MHGQQRRDSSTTDTMLQLHTPGSAYSDSRNRTSSMNGLLMRNHDKQTCSMLHDDVLLTLACMAVCTGRCHQSTFTCMYWPCGAHSGSDLKPAVITRSRKGSHAAHTHNARSTTRFHGTRFLRINKRLQRERGGTTAHSMARVDLRQKRLCVSPFTNSPAPVHTH